MNEPSFYVIAGEAQGGFEYGDVTKEIKGSVIAIVGSRGSLVVLDGGKGIKPLCYIEEGADITLTNEQPSGPFLTGVAGDGRIISIHFTRPTAQTHAFAYYRERI